MSRRSMGLIGLALLGGLRAAQSKSDDLSGVPLKDLQLGPKGIEIKKGSPSDPLRKHRKGKR